MEEYVSREQYIQQLKEELQSMDYIALKSYEGQNCEQYGDWKSERQEIRDKINSLAAMSDEEWDAQFDMPENVNIQVAREAMASGASAPTAFQAWEHGCEEALALTNTIWGLKVNTQEQLGKAREQDIAEKFSLYKGMTEAAFGLYKNQIDADFSLYKNQRDMYDALDGKYAAKFAELDKKVAVMEAVRPYQDRLLMDYTDKKTCRCIYGELVLPSTPTVTGYQSASPFGCNCARQTAAQTA